MLVAALAFAGSLVGMPAHAAGPVTGLGVDVSLVDFAFLDTSSPDPVTTLLPVRAGHQYALVVSGAYSYGPGLADGECSTNVSDNVWRPWRYVGAFNDFQTDYLDAYVDGKAVDWTPVNHTGHCDPDTHYYEYLFTPTTTAPVSFSLKDAYYGDNSGTLTIGVFYLGGLVEAGTRLIPPLPTGP